MCEVSRLRVFVLSKGVSCLKYVTFSALMLCRKVNISTIIGFSVAHIIFFVQWFYKNQLCRCMRWIVHTMKAEALSFNRSWCQQAKWDSWPIMICFDCGHSCSIRIVLLFQIHFNKAFGLEAIICLLTSSPWLIEEQLDSWAHIVLCSLLWCMRDMNALASISVVAAPKGGQSLCSAAGQANTNSEVLWLYQTSWLCVCEFCGLPRSSAPHLKMSFNCKLLGV